jgi:hypothetical protein
VKDGVGAEVKTGAPFRGYDNSIGLSIVYERNDYAGNVQLLHSLTCTGFSCFKYLIIMKRPFRVPPNKEIPGHNF